MSDSPSSTTQTGKYCYYNLEQEKNDKRCFETEGKNGEKILYTEMSPRPPEVFLARSKLKHTVFAGFSPSGLTTKIIDH